jgi:CheY-like chemotaxis protein
MHPLRVGPLVKETLKLLRATVPNSIDITENIHPGRDTILAEPTQIQQIIMNLCANAVHAMRETGGTLTVGLDVAPAAACPASGEAPAGDCLRLWVADTGPGIAPEIADRIFDPFFTTKKPGEGTGMGLAVAHGIARKYHGEIKLKSAPGQGATFEIFLPLADQAPAAEREESAHPTMGRGRVLFVDDEAALAEIGRELLEPLGYQVITETDPRQALARFRSDPRQVDILITDQNMPGLTGADLTREVLAVRPDLPVLMLTGFSETITRERARELGIREFLLKPILRRDLAAAIETALGRGNGVAGSGRNASGGQGAALDPLGGMMPPRPPRRGGIA